MPFSNIIDREAVQTADGPPGGLIPEDAAREIIQEATESSAVMGVARRLPNMSRAQRRLPVFGAKPSAFFVNGDTGLKQTTDAEWKDVFVNAEELAAIVPVPDNVLADADYDIWAELRPEMAEAIGQAVDLAILYGTAAPSSWPDDLMTQIDAAGHTVALGTGDDLYDDLLAEDGVISKVEEDGYAVTGHLAALTLRAKLRGLRETDGLPIFKPLPAEGVQGRSRYELDGEPLIFPRNGGLDPTESLLVSGDWSRLVFAIRQDLTFDLNNQGVITDNAGDIVYNLWQQDMTALRVTFRLGWALPNPPNRVNDDDDTRFAFAALTPEAS